MMKLFWIIFGYSAIVAFSFWLGEHLQDRREAARRRAEAAHPSQRDEPLQGEVIPDPRQRAQMATKDLERLALALAGQLGYDTEKIRGIFVSGTVCCPPKEHPVTADARETEENS